MLDGRPTLALDFQLSLGSLEILVEVALHAGDVVPGGLQATLLGAVQAEGFELSWSLVDLQAERLGA